MSEAELLAMFPSWADITDVKKSLGIYDELQREPRPVVPIAWEGLCDEQSRKACADIDLPFNELACQCESYTGCELGCMGDNVFLSPFS